MKSHIQLTEIENNCDYDLENQIFYFTFTPNILQYEATECYSFMFNGFYHF